MNLSSLPGGSNSYWEYLGNVSFVHSRVPLVSKDVINNANLAGEGSQSHGCDTWGCVVLCVLTMDTHSHYYCRLPDYQWHSYCALSLSGKSHLVLQSGPRNITGIWRVIVGFYSLGYTLPPDMNNCPHVFSKTLQKLLHYQTNKSLFHWLKKLAVLY